ncbi:MAG: hypothetical protein KDE15_02035 [Erythrobacter sp.]|nr:hypothetical protein [Erythrobacter sp.]
MARPRRAGAELAAVERAFAAMPAELSTRAKAVNLAARVAREMVDQAESTDPMDMALRQASAALARDPVMVLATDPEIGLHALLDALKVERFRARGGGWIDREAWARETVAIERDLAARLATRFRRARKKWP